MSRWYVDTSAAWKLVARETESEVLAHAIDAASPDLIGCWLLDTEMRRAVPRNPHVTQQMVSELLEEIDLCEVPASVFREAGRLPGEHLRSLDAIHLAAAIDLDVDAVLTYDTRMSESARLLGLRVLAPA